MQPGSYPRVALGAKRLICFRKTNWPDRSNPSSRSVHEAQVATIRQDRCIILTPSNASMPSRAPASRQFSHSHRSVWSCKDNKSHLGLSCAGQRNTDPCLCGCLHFCLAPKTATTLFREALLSRSFCMLLQYMSSHAASSVRRCKSSRRSKGYGSESGRNSPLASTSP